VDCLKRSHSVLYQMRLRGPNLSLWGPAGREPFAPVSGIVGGLLANDIMKAISARGEPTHNFLFFSARDMQAVVVLLGPR
jgi:hypothetical protein